MGLAGQPRPDGSEVTVPEGFAFRRIYPVRRNVAGHTSEVRVYPATFVHGLYLTRTTWPPVGHRFGPMPLAGAMLQFET